MKKRNSIRFKIVKISLVVSIFSLVLVGSISLLSMFKIQNDSKVAIIDQVEENIRNILDDKVLLAGSELSKYIGYINNCSYIIHDMYVNSSSYEKITPLPPIKGNFDFALQRAFINESIKYEDVKEEIELLSNLERVWKPSMTSENMLITTIYIGTKSGFMLAYDNDSDSSANDDNSEIYFNYMNSDWYLLAMNRYKQASFTNIYNDAFNRGSMITCVEPFYNANNEFAGVIGMDILISDLYKSLISLNSDNHYKAFIVDSIGNIISVNDDIDEHTNIMYLKGLDYSLANSILRGETGVKKSNGYYYGYKPIINTNWKYCIYIPEDIVFKTLDTINDSIFIAMIIFSLITVIVILVVMYASQKLAVRLTLPIIALENVAEGISEGHFDYRAKIYDNDEIGDLANKMNNMAMTLQMLVQFNK